MNIHIPALPRKLSDAIAEYDEKRKAIPDALAAFNRAGDDLKIAASVVGTWGQVTIETGRVYERELQMALLKSAWLYVYSALGIDRLASPDDKQRFKRAMESPPEFTTDNVRATFWRFVADPRGNILRGMAEVFCGLDPFYKSHDKIKVGVKGMPKRIIIGYVDDYGSHGRDKIESVLNALAAFEQKPLVTWRELSMLLRDENALAVDREVAPDRTFDEPMKIVGRGIRLRRFKNKNAHLFFDEPQLRSINLALAEFYGDVVPDAYEAKPDARAPSTAVAADLQYYATPEPLAASIVANIYGMKGSRVLDPSCGCGRLLDAARKAGAAHTAGIEVHPGRAMTARSKGHPVLLANFLQHPAPATDADAFDFVLMNPPFYGKHYAKHVKHALDFVRPGGKLVSILPATARYDHGLLSGSWQDLPIGSFSESGTNISTTVLTIQRAKP